MKSTIPIFFLLLIAVSSNSQMRVAKIFNEHMVVQRETPIKIWGWSSPKDIIVGSFNRIQQNTITNDDGYWELSFDAQKAGGPYALQIASASRRVDWQDIYVGDVWMCSGQSNMEWPVKYALNPEQELANAAIPELRHIRVPRSYSESPEEDIEGGVWQVSNKNSAGDFSAVGYYFAKEIIASEEIPIGLINTSWGGARIEPYMSASANRIEDLTAFFEDLDMREQKMIKALREKLNRRFNEYKEPPAFLNEPLVKWEEAQLDDAHWSTMQLPVLWENAGLSKVDGVMWFRKEITLNQEELESINALHLGPIDDSDITWVNGVKVGSMQNSYNVDRNYKLTAGILKKGKNTIAIRVEDTGYGGGIYGAPEDMGLFGENMVKSLKGEWKINAEAVYLNSLFDKNAIATLLYNKMIFPLTKLPIKGVLWYQGESNAGPTDAGVYRDQFRSLILDWRSAWGQESLPFFFVQLANFMDPVEEPVESSWALLRESQATALKLPNTGMAVAIDIGDQHDIHPRNKQEVGRRLALNAQHEVYEKDITFSGPIIQSAVKENDKIVLTFKYADGLNSTQTNPPGFAVSDATGKYDWVSAELRGEQIILNIAGISVPNDVRYGWADNPDVSIYNGAKLPAAPFQIKIAQ